MDDYTKDLLTRIANGNYHREPMIRARRVAGTTLFDHLKQDVDYIIKNHPSTVVADGHVTNWTDPVGKVEQWSLWNRNGITNTTAEDFNYVLTGKRAPHGAPNIQAFAEKLPALVNLRLNCLHPGASLSPHEEHLPRTIDQDRVALRARFHMPIYTNKDSLMLADNQWFRFYANGNVYFFNNGCVHGAKNEGDTPRYHLVWDQLMTQEAVDVMFRNGNEYLEIRGRGAPRVGPEENITEYARSGGLDVKEFDRRELIVHP